MQSKSENNSNWNVSSYVRIALVWFLLGVVIAFAIFFPGLLDRQGVSNLTPPNLGLGLNLLFQASQWFLKVSSNSLMFISVVIQVGIVFAIGIAVALVVLALVAGYNLLHGAFLQKNISEVLTEAPAVVSELDPIQQDERPPVLQKNTSEELPQDLTELSELDSIQPDEQPSILQNNVSAALAEDPTVVSALDPMQQDERPIVDQCIADVIAIVRALRGGGKVFYSNAGKLDEQKVKHWETEYKTCYESFEQRYAADPDVRLFPLYTLAMEAVENIKNSEEIFKNFILNDQDPLAQQLMDPDYYRGHYARCLNIEEQVGDNIDSVISFFNLAKPVIKNNVTLNELEQKKQILLDDALQPITEKIKDLESQIGELNARLSSAKGKKAKSRISKQVQIGNVSVINRNIALLESKKSTLEQQAIEVENNVLGLPDMQALENESRALTAQVEEAKCVLKKEYRMLALRYHPDKSSTLLESSVKAHLFKSINEINSKVENTKDNFNFAEIEQDLINLEQTVGNRTWHYQELMKNNDDAASEAIQPTHSLSDVQDTHQQKPLTVALYSYPATCRQYADNSRERSPAILTEACVIPTEVVSF